MDSISIVKQIHTHVVTFLNFGTKAKSDEQLVAETMKCADYVKEKIALSTKL